MNITPPAHVSVVLDSSDLVHIVRYRVFNDGTGASLCGRTPFPEKWEEFLISAGGRQCPTCVDRWKRKG